jgi:hypothetical protein
MRDEDQRQKPEPPQPPKQPREKRGGQEVVPSTPKEFEKPPTPPKK